MSSDGVKRNIDVLPGYHAVMICGDGLVHYSQDDAGKFPGHTTGSAQRLVDLDIQIAP